MQKLIVLSMTTLLYIYGAQAKTVKQPEINILQENLTSITIEFTLDEYEISQEEINGISCAKVMVPGAVRFLQKGLPELPTFARSIIIPGDAIMDHQVINVDYEIMKVDPIVPSKGNLYRDVAPRTIPYKFDKFYQTDSWWPQNIVQLYEPFILRDYRGLTIRFNPFQYNPHRNELKVAKRILIEVYEARKGGPNQILKKKRSISQEFASLYKRMFLNFNDSRYDSISERPGRMIIITADAYNDEMQSFMYWKNLKGIKTKIENISVIGNDEISIRNYIQNEYDLGNLVWVLLVGDADEVMPATGTVGSATGALADPVYAYTAGSDYFPDIFVSRFSSLNGNPVNIEKQVSRSVYYERTPVIGGNWYHIGLGVASNQTQGGGPRDSTRCNWLRDSLLQYHYTEVNKSYDPWGTTAMIKGYIEAGTGIINYIGHGHPFGWANGGGFTTTDINMLNNPWETPFVISVACWVGYFDSIDCYCEVSVTAGEVNQPDGFLAHWGSSIPQSWVPPCYGQEGANNLLTHDQKNTFGGICFNGACYMIEEYLPQDDGIEMAQTWHIFGDASVQLRTDVPDNMIVTHDSVVLTADAIFPVNVKDDDGVTPIQGALVCCWVHTQIPEVHETGFTDASGNLILNVSPTNSGDTMWVTVTKSNYAPYEGYAIVRDPTHIAEEKKKTLAPHLEVYPTIASKSLCIACNQVQSAGDIELKIYNATGQLVKNLISSTAYPQLPTVIPWNGKDDYGRRVPAGIYFVHFATLDHKEIKKVILLR
jgi:hypothetical protein